MRGDDAARIEAALPSAAARLSRAGLPLTTPPTITIHQTREDFARATGQVDADLRAWTTWQHVRFMPLSTWAASDSRTVAARVTHELCHVALYQRFGTEAQARRARIPRFFEEGLCSVVADQQRLALDLVIALGPPMPLAIELFQEDPELAYAAAHHAIAFLDDHAPGWLSPVLARAARDGAPGCVERALEAVTGFSPAGLWRAVVHAAAPTAAARAP